MYHYLAQRNEIRIMPDPEKLGPLGKVLTLYQELRDAKKLQFLSAEQRRAELDETIANSAIFKKTFLAEHRTLSP
jgi:hypothetical protein